MYAFAALASLLAGIVLPGYCLARRLIRSADLVESAVYTAALGLIAVPTVTFVAAWAFGLPFNRPLVLGAALGIALLCRPWSMPEAPRATGGQILALGVLVIAAFALLQLTYIRAGSGLKFFKPCLHLIALFLQQHDGSGWTLYDPEMIRHVTHVLHHPSSPALGLEPIIGDQRVTNGSVLAVVLVLSGRAGIELTTLLLYMIIAGGGAMVARAKVGSMPARIAVGLATLVGLHQLMAYMVNETVFALAAGLMVLALLVRDEAGPKELGAAGLFLGFAVGSHLGALLWVLPVGLMLKGLPWRSRLAATGAFVGSVLPWLLVPAILEGNPFFYPSPEDSMVEHTLFGWTFLFRPLNWPFYEELVRAPGHRLPALLLLPVRVLRSAGSLLSAAMLVGFGMLWRRDRRISHGWLVTAWAAPMAIFLHGLVYTDYEKATWLLLGAPVAPLMLAGFVKESLTRGNRALVFAAWALLAVVLAFLPHWLSRVEVGVDKRAYAIVPPNFMPEVRSEEEERRNLGRMALMPSLQSGGQGSALWDSLTNALGGEPFQSGSIVVWLDQRDPQNLMFQVHTTQEEPTLPDITSTDPDDWVEVDDEVVLAVHIRIPAAQTATVHIQKEQSHFQVMIDPGPLPHEPRYISFLVDDHWNEEFNGVAVEVSGMPLPVRCLGYLVRSEDEEVHFRDPRLVTNLPVPLEPLTSGWVLYRNKKLLYDWAEFGPDGACELEASSSGPIPDSARGNPVQTDHQE